MSDENKGKVFPPTTEGGSDAEVMTVGCWRMRVDDIDDGVNADGEPIVDNRNHPCKKITFINEKGERMSSLFFYNGLPADDPNRNDDQLRCKSEFKFTNLKKAMKIDFSKVKSLDEVKKHYFYGVVQRQEYYDPDDPLKVIRTYHGLDSTFYPDEQRPVIDGDPKNNDGKPSGVFLKRVPANIKQVARWKKDSEGSAETQDTDVADAPDTDTEGGESPSADF